MIIAITWVGNTGKTYTRLNTFKHLKHYWEIARELLEEFPQIHKTPLIFQKYILLREIERVKELEQEEDDCIVDRTFLDNIIYIEERFSKDSEEYKELKPLIDSIDIERVKKLYDQVILFTLPFKDSSKFPEFDYVDFNTKFINKIKETFKDNLYVTDNSYTFITNE